MAKDKDKNLEEWLNSQFGTGIQAKNDKEGSKEAKEMDDAELKAVLNSLGGTPDSSKSDKLSGILEKISESDTKEDRIKAKQREYLERVIGADKELEWLKDEYKDLLNPAIDKLPQDEKQKKPSKKIEKKKSRKSYLTGDLKEIKEVKQKKKDSGKKVKVKSQKSNIKTNISNKSYKKALKKLQSELAIMHNWVSGTGQRVVVLFEGRDAAGKGGTIKRINQHLNPRVCRIEALPKPSESERTQWYFQRYVSKLPAAGEIVLFDRSWYNRAGVEPVMEFCSAEQHEKFLHVCPNFEKNLVDDGIILIKYWFEVSPQIQESRLKERVKDRSKHWKISKVDEVALPKFMDYTKARDLMFEKTHSKHAPWNIVKADNKKLARLNCISDLLDKIPYTDLETKAPSLGNLEFDDSYKSVFKGKGTYVKDRYPK